MTVSRNSSLIESGRMFTKPVNSPIQPNLVWARNPHGGGYLKLLCHPQTIDKVMELGSESKLGEYCGLVHGNPPVPPDGFDHCQTSGLLEPHAIFKGLKRPLHFEHSAADSDIYVFVTDPDFSCGYRPSREGDAVMKTPKPIESVFTTYATLNQQHIDPVIRSVGKSGLGKIDGIVLFWEWTESARDNSLLPYDSKTRYAMRIDE